MLISGVFGCRFCWLILHEFFLTFLCCFDMGNKVEEKGFSKVEYVRIDGVFKALLHPLLHGRKKDKACGGFWLFVSCLSLIWLLAYCCGVHTKVADILRYLTFVLDCNEN